MLARPVRWLSVAALLALAPGCDTAREVKTLSSQTMVAEKELRETVGQSARVKVTGPGIDGPFSVVVIYDSMPPGITRQDLEKSVNIVIRRTIKKVTTVEVVVPPPK